MKIKRILLLFVVIVITFSSCEEAHLRRLHNKMLNTELDKYSDIFDLSRTKIEFSGRGYYWIPSSPPVIEVYLFLKPTHDNREELISIRNEFIDYFNKNWRTDGNKGFYYRIAITFMIEKNQENIPFYILTHEIHYDGWTEWWYQENIEIPYKPSSIKVEEFGRPLIGKPINNKKLNTILDKYFNGSYIEHFDGFHSGTDFIRMRLIINNNCNSEMVLEIKDDLIAFFEDNKQELINEYGQYDAIWIIFYRLENKYYRGFFYLTYRRNKWESSWR